MTIFKRKEVRNAVLIAIISSVSYFAVYIARNILSVMTPQIVEKTSFTVEFIGTLSTANMLCYAIGQLINGIIGDKVKGKYLVSGGLFLAGICNLVVGFSTGRVAIAVAYSLCGFCLSMIYAPLTKLIAENTHPVHAARCCLAMGIAALFGAPAAGIAALLFDWKGGFILCGVFLFFMGTAFFLSILNMEKREIVKYKKIQREAKKGGSIKVLIEHEIVKFSLVAVLTGIVRTSVVFWIPTYLSQYLKFSAAASASVFTLVTLVQAITPTFNNLILYERLFKRNRDRVVLFAFSSGAICFILMFAVHKPIANILFLLLALALSHGGADMLWCVYCPGLHETGMVSTATGYLDFMSYMAAAVANLLFANAINQIGWGNLILVWAALMFVGVIVSLPRKKRSCTGKYS